MNEFEGVEAILPPSREHLNLESLREHYRKTLLFIGDLEERVLELKGKAAEDPRAELEIEIDLNPKIKELEETSKDIAKLIGDLEAKRDVEIHQDTLVKNEMDKTFFDN
jgi:hypothetical protein